LPSDSTIVNRSIVTKSFFDLMISLGFASFWACLAVKQYQGSSIAAVVDTDFANKNFANFSSDPVELTADISFLFLSFFVLVELVWHIFLILNVCVCRLGDHDDTRNFYSLKTCPMVIGILMKIMVVISAGFVASEFTSGGNLLNPASPEVDVKIYGPLVAYDALRLVEQIALLIIVCCQSCNQDDSGLQGSEFNYKQWAHIFGLLGSLVATTMFGLHLAEFSAGDAVEPSTPSAVANGFVAAARLGCAFFGFTCRPWHGQRRDEQALLEATH
jgi:hypothetical protein